MEESIAIKGLSDLQKMLDTLPAKLEANILRGALRAGMKVILVEAKSNVSSVSGELARGLQISTSIKSKLGSVTATLRAKGKHGFIAGWVEYGTAAHLIKVQDSEKPINYRKSLKSGKLTYVSMTTINRNVLKIGNTFVGPTIMHPGAKPKPFMRPALDSRAHDAVLAAADYIKSRLTKEGLNLSGVEVG